MPPYRIPRTSQTYYNLIPKNTFNKMKKTLPVLILLFSVNLFSQDLNQKLSLVAGEYAQSYLQPFIDAYGAGFNSGFFHSAKLPDDSQGGLHISFSIQSTGAFIPAAEKSFNAVYQTTAVIDTNGQSYNVAAKATVNNAPTIFGSSDPGKAIIDINDTITVAGLFGYPVHETREYDTFGSVLNTNIAPLFVPQLNVGSYLGTEILIRWFPPVHLGNFGTTGYFGFGVRHNLNQYLPSLPLNVAGGFSYQNFTIDDTNGVEFLSASTYSFAVQVSKDFGMFNLYGAVQFEGSALNVNYQYNPPSNSNNANQYKVNINFTLHGKNSFRILAGGNLNLGGFFINADLDISSINAVNIGIGYNIF